MISLSVWNKNAFTFLFFRVAHPVEFLLNATNFAPITHLPINSNIAFQVYMRGLLFRYVISHLCDVKGEICNG